MPAVGLFLGGLAAGLSGTGVIIGLPIGGALGAGTAVGAFLAANAGTLLIAGAALAYQAFQNSRPQAQSSVNVRIPAGPRWHVAGKRKVGGNVVFADFDADGALWYIIVHCDSELMVLDHYEFDNIPIAIDGSNRVTTEEFKAWAGGLLGVGQSLTPFFSVWTSTFSPSDPVPPPPPAAFLAAFPEWTDDHKLAGTTFSTVKIDPVDDKQKAQIYKWQQGAIRLGEPGISIVGTWGRIYDPNDEDQDIDDQSTWGSSTNAALIFAWNRYRKYGFDADINADLNWDEIAAEALICDQPVEDKYAVEWPRYACGVAFSEEMSNASCEQQILLCCDGVVMTDSEGKVYLRTGHYDAPTVTISGKRDILAMQSREIEDGEAETSGVVVTYTSDELGYVPTPAAPWKNPAYYVEGQTPNYLQVTIEGCPNHNQAVRLAKAIGLRSQAAHRLAPTVGVRALRLRTERIIDLDYDEDFSGPYLIYVPVELDGSYLAGAVGLVPIDENNWTLLSGEEGDKPRLDVVENDDGLPLLDPEDVEISVVPVAGSNGNSVRVEAEFPEPPSATYSYAFDYSVDGGTTWQAFATDMQALMALTPVIDASSTVLVRWRTVSSGGNYSDYNDPPIEVTASADVTFDQTGITFDSTLFTWDAE